MNILYICDEYPPGEHGGIGSAVKMLANKVADMGHNVYVAGLCDWGYGGEDRFMDGKVEVFRYRMQLSTPWFADKTKLSVRGSYKFLKVTGVLYQDVKVTLKKYQKFLDELVEKYKIDIVERPDFNDYMRYCKNYLSPVTFNVPTFVKLHGTITYFNQEAGTDTSTVIRQMERDLLKNADTLISVSRYTADKTLQYLDLEKKVQIIYNGIEVPAEPSVEKNNKLVVFTGSIVPKKGIYQLMKAWNTVIESVPDARLYIYGKGAVDKAQELLTDIAKNRVEFKGHVHRETLHDSLAKSMAAVFPSYAETFGLGAVEAMSVGTAVIFTTRTSGPEVVQDNINGLLVDPDNVDAIADAIIKLLTDKDLNKRLSEKGVQSVKDKFDIDKITREHIQLYKEVIAENATG